MVLRLLVEETDRTVATRLAVTLSLVVAGGVLAGLAPLALQQLVDAVAGAADTGIAFPGPGLAFGALYLLALCGGRLLTELRPLCAGVAEQRLFSRLRQRFFDHLLRVRLEFHGRRSTGALVHGLQQATIGFQLVVAHMINSVVPVLVEVGTVIVVFAQLDQPALMATFAATAVAYAAVFALGAARLTERARAVTDAGMHVHACLTDSLLNVEAIRCFQSEPAAGSRLRQASAALEDRWRMLGRQRARVGVALVAVFAASTVASLGLAAQAVAAGTLTIGGFVLANVYLLQIVRPLEMLGSAVRDLSQALAFIGPLLAVLREPAEPGPDPLDRPAPGDQVLPAVPTGAPCIRFEDIRFAYESGRPVLDGVDLEIVAGTVVAIVGASGTGKSSLVRLLLRLYEPAAGRILLDGVPIDALPIDELRTATALVPQDTTLFNDTIAANIGIGWAGADRQAIEDAARIAQLHEFVMSLPAGYDTVVGERGLRLSGGERQRIAIARAVLRRPRVLVLDEATSALDGRTEAAVLRNLGAATAGCTTITIAHRLSTACRADQIVVMEDGRIVERGAHATLLALGGAYARLWRAQGQGQPS